MKILAQEWRAWRRLLWDLHLRAETRSPLGIVEVTARWEFKGLKSRSRKLRSSHQRSRRSLALASVLNDVVFALNRHNPTRKGRSKTSPDSKQMGATCRLSCQLLEILLGKMDSAVQGLPTAGRPAPGSYARSSSKPSI